MKEKDYEMTDKEKDDKENEELTFYSVIHNAEYIDRLLNTSIQLDCPSV